MSEKPNNSIAAMKTAKTLSPNNIVCYNIKSKKKAATSKTSNTLKCFLFNLEMYR